MTNDLLDFEVLTSTIRYNARDDCFSAYDSKLNWYRIPADRVKAYAARFSITMNEAVEELMKFTMVEASNERGLHMRYKPYCIRTNGAIPLVYVKGSVFEDALTSDESCLHSIGIRYESRRGYHVDDLQTGMLLSSHCYRTKLEAESAYFSEIKGRFEDFMKTEHYREKREELSRLLVELDDCAIEGTIWQAQKVANPFAIDLELRTRLANGILLNISTHYADSKFRAKTDRFECLCADEWQVIDAICRRLRKLDGIDLATSDEVQIENEITDLLGRQR